MAPLLSTFTQAGLNERYFDGPFDGPIGKTVGMPAVAHQNKLVELAMRILQRRQKLRRVGWDEEQAKSLRAEIDRLAQQLRELDE